MHHMLLKRLFFGSKLYIKELKMWSVHVFWARLASFGHLGLISEHLMVSWFQSSTMESMIHNTSLILFFKKKLLWIYNLKIV